ncbi:molybdenum metabolism regulator [Niastella yeongjuensis]|uniref:Molybdenum metabolism regulator n=1 Tax=Niastella yeongjuensis TaxID=354355 RepID=A0A1V9E4S9_9BACT|nr:molybdenum metabolism regulator [Niastella yeongjuensis]
MDPEKYVYRLQVHYDDEGVTISDLLEALVRDPQAGKITELIIGQFDNEVSESSFEVIDKLVSLKHDLKNLKALFIGEMTYEECEISWINQTDITPILKAYPELEHLQIRGGDGLSFSDLQHDNLHTLIIETGGMPPNVIQEVNAARLPNLQKLELWLGSGNYGFASKVEDFAPILSGKQFPKLTHLGLMDSEIQDDIAIAAAQAPVVNQLQVLDLSKGVLTDKGGEALRDSAVIRNLQHLNLRYHFMSEDMMAQLKALNMSVNLDEKQTEDDEDYRFVEVAE